MMIWGVPSEYAKRQAARRGSGDLAASAWHASARGSFLNTGPLDRPATRILSCVVALGLLVFAALLAVPYVAGRVLWRIRMPLAVRVTVVVAVPAVLVWWLGTSPDFADITSPGAALIPLAVIVGWLLGTSSVLRRKLIVAAGEHTRR